MGAPFSRAAALSLRWMRASAISVELHEDRELLLREKARDCSELVGRERLNEAVDQLVADLPARDRRRGICDAGWPRT